MQATTAACEEKAQSFQNVDCYSTNTAAVVRTVNEISEIPLYNFCQRITHGSASTAFGSLQEGSASWFAHTCSVVALRGAAAEHLVLCKRNVAFL